MWIRSVPCTVPLFFHVWKFEETQLILQTQYRSLLCASFTRVGIWIILTSSFFSQSCSSFDILSNNIILLPHIKHLTNAESSFALVTYIMSPNFELMNWHSLVCCNVCNCLKLIKQFQQRPGQILYQKLLIQVLDMQSWCREPSIGCNY